MADSNNTFPQVNNISPQTSQVNPANIAGNQPAGAQNPTFQPVMNSSASANRSSKTKTILIAVAVLLLSTAVAAGVFLVNQQQELRREARQKTVILDEIQDKRTISDDAVTIEDETGAIEAEQRTVDDGQKSPLEEIEGKPRPVVDVGTIEDEIGDVSDSERVLHGEEDGEGEASENEEASDPYGGNCSGCAWDMICEQYCTTTDCRHVGYRCGYPQDYDYREPRDEPRWWNSCIENADGTRGALQYERYTGDPCFENYSKDSTGTGKKDHDPRKCPPATPCTNIIHCPQGGGTALECMGQFVCCGGWGGGGGGGGDNDYSPPVVPPTAVPPTSVPPTAVPPTKVPPTTAPTPIPVACQAVHILQHVPTDGHHDVYKLLTKEEIKSLKAGDKIYLGVTYTLSKEEEKIYHSLILNTSARVRVNETTWLAVHETEKKQTIGGVEGFIKEFTIPEGVYSFKVEAQVNIGGWTYGPTPTIPPVGPPKIVPTIPPTATTAPTPTSKVEDPCDPLSCSCSGAGYEVRNCLNGDVVYVDCAANRCWSSTFSSTGWTPAKTHCNNLTHGGKSDWYLPDVRILRNLCASNSCSGTCFGGEGVGTSYWSSEGYDHELALSVSFNPDHCWHSVNSKTNQSIHLRCTR